jgi:hypothetical protein
LRILILDQNKEKMIRIITYTGFTLNQRTAPAAIPNSIQKLTSYYSLTKAFIVWIFSDTSDVIDTQELRVEIIDQFFFYQIQHYLAIVFQIYIKTTEGCIDLKKKF